MLLAGTEGAEGAEGARANNSALSANGVGGLDDLTPGATTDGAVHFSLLQEDLSTGLSPNSPSDEYKVKHPDFSEAGRFEKWSPDIRFVNLMTELMRPVHVSVNPGRQAMTVRHVELSPDDVTAEVWKGGFRALPVYSISRPSVEFFQKQIPLVLQWADLRVERASEVVSQIGIPLQYWASLTDLNPTTHRYTIELIHLATQFSSHLNQASKHHLGCPRPTAYSPWVHTIIRPRRFDCYPSGHALEAFLVAKLLKKLMPSNPVMARKLELLAARIAMNRVIAGVHFPIDAFASRAAALGLADYIAARGTGGTMTWNSRAFDGAGLKATDALMYDDPLKLDGKDWVPPPTQQSAPAQSMFNLELEEDKRTGFVQHLWGKARSEWQ